MKQLIIGSLSALLLSASANAAVIYGVDENNNLVSFDSALPGVFTSSVKITGVDSSLEALDFRPRNNALYGLGIDRVVYTINPISGIATAVTAALPTGTAFGFDFNPTIDRLRVVSNTNENYVVDPNTGSVTTATPVMYAASDVNAGRNADVTAAAYTSSVFGAAAGTTQLFAIDTANDVLVRQANSAGTLTTVGATGFDLGSRTSFDISGSNAFAFNGQTLYSVDLTTGALTSLGNTSRSLFGIAISPVPEPATWAMILVGFAMVGAAVRYRSRPVRIAYS